MAYSWDEFCDKAREPSRKVGNYALATYAGAPQATPPETTWDLIHSLRPQRLLQAAPQAWPKAQASMVLAKPLAHLPEGPSSRLEFFARLAQQSGLHRQAPQNPQRTVF